MTNILTQYSHTTLFDATLVIQLLFTLSFLISASFVFANPYNGFNTIFLGIVYLAFIGVSFYCIRYDISRTKFGAILAACLYLVFLSLENAIYWGQYSNCSVPGFFKYFADHIIYCNNTAAMSSVSAFSVLMFLSYLFELFLLFRFKDNFLGTDPLNEGTGQVGGYVPVKIPSPLHGNKDAHRLAVLF